MHAPPSAFQTETFTLREPFAQGLLGVKSLVGDCRWAVFDVSLGYTEQQEWVWSLSSTLGREVLYDPESGRGRK